MGELFKHFEGWDVQALRQETEDVRKKAEIEMESVKREAQEKVDSARRDTTECGIRKLLNSIKKFHATRSDAVVQLMEEYQLSSAEAEEKVNLYW